MSDTCNSCGSTQAVATTTVPAAAAVRSPMRYRIQNMDCPPKRR